jgi:hypothetical protein
VVIQPVDTAAGLPAAAQNSTTSVSFAFTGFDN